MKRIKTIVFVLVPVYIEIARTRAPKTAVVVSSQDRHFHDRREAASEWPFFVLRTIFQSICIVGVAGWLKNKEENEY